MGTYTSQPPASTAIDSAYSSRVAFAWNFADTLPQVGSNRFTAGSGITRTQASGIWSGKAATNTDYERYLISGPANTGGQAFSFVLLWVGIDSGRTQNHHIFGWDNGGGGDARFAYMDGDTSGVFTFSPFDTSLSAVGANNSGAPLSASAENNLAMHFDTAKTASMWVQGVQGTKSAAMSGTPAYGPGGGKIWILNNEQQNHANTGQARGMAVLVNVTDAEVAALSANVWSLWAGGPAAAAVLSSATGVATGATTANIGVTTDTAAGTLYYVVTNSATAPTATQIKAGQDHTGSAAAKSGSGTPTLGANAASLTGLTTGTTYYAHWVQNTTGGDSNVSSYTTGFIPTSVSVKIPLFYYLQGNRHV